MSKVILAVILILSLLLLLYANSSAAGWEHLASRGVYVYYYDLDNIQHLSGITDAAKDEIFELEDYSISTMVINCADKIVGAKSIVSYKEGGEIILNTNYNKINYLYIPSGSIHKALYDKVC
jgi:hypothetical protein